MSNPSPIDRSLLAMGRIRSSPTHGSSRRHDTSSNNPQSTSPKSAAGLIFFGSAETNKAPEPRRDEENDRMDNENSMTISGEEKDVATAIVDGEEGNAQSTAGNVDDEADTNVSDEPINNECKLEIKAPSMEVQGEARNENNENSKIAVRENQGAEKEIKKPAEEEVLIAESEVKTAVMSIEKSNMENKEQLDLAESQAKSTNEDAEPLADEIKEQTKVANAVETSDSEKGNKKKRNKLGLRLPSALSKALSKPKLSNKKLPLPIISMRKLGAKNQDTSDANILKSTEDHVAPTVAVYKEDEEDRKAQAATTTDETIADDKMNKILAKSINNAKSPDDNVDIQRTHSTLSILTNDTTYTEYIIAEALDDNNVVVADDNSKKARKEEEVLQSMQKKTLENGLKEEVEVSIEELRARIEEIRAREQIEEMHTMNEEQVLSSKNVQSSGSYAGCGIMSIFASFGSGQEGGVMHNNELENTADDTISIASNEARFVLNHVTDSNNSSFWSQSLLNEIKDVENSLSVIEVKDSASTQKMANIKQHLLSGNHQTPTFPPSTSEEVKAGYYRALSRAAVLNAKMESRRAELELKKIELESIRVEEQIGWRMMGDNGSLEEDSDDDDDTYLDSLATNESEEGFFSVLPRLFRSQKKRRKGSRDATTGAVTTKAFQKKTKGG